MCLEVRRIIPCRTLVQTTKGVTSVGERENYLRVPIIMPLGMFVGLEELSIKAKVTSERELTNTGLVRAAAKSMLEMELM